jgi:hypothetical protein
MRTRPLILSEELERAILHGILEGKVAVDSVDGEELSKTGKQVHASLKSLSEGGVKPPFQYSSVILHASEVFGASKDALKTYLKAVALENVGTDAVTILQKVRDKKLLMELVTEAAKQFKSGDVNVTFITDLLTRANVAGGDLAPLSTMVGDTLPEPPVGRTLRSLPKLQECTGGIIGNWAIGGPPGIGKSKLVWQIIADVGREGVPALVYDFENTLPVLLYRQRAIYKDSLEKIREAMSHVYLREHIHTLDQDLRTVKPPALIVIDSVQSLPSFAKDHRVGLNSWIYRLDNLKKQGYNVLMVSEIPKYLYEQEPTLSAFKETGAIEYKADCAMLLTSAGYDDNVELHIVKNRHRPKKGLVSVLSSRNDWWWREDE